MKNEGTAQSHINYQTTNVIFILLWEEKRELNALDLRKQMQIDRTRAN